MATTSAMRLRFPESEIVTLSDRYSYARREAQLLRVRDSVRRQGYLTKAQLRRLAQWKSPRSAPRVEANTEGFVREITQFALAASDERARIEPLTLLSGVMWPTASAILHLFHRDQYPILDFRALWSVSARVPVAYHFDYWQPYVQFIRSVAKRTSVDVRTLDRALWQYSKENQRAF